jgi:hypothetical protein
MTAPHDVLTASDVLRILEDLDAQLSSTQQDGQAAVYAHVSQVLFDHEIEPDARDLVITKLREINQRYGFDWLGN